MTFGPYAANVPPVEARHARDEKLEEQFYKEPLCQIHHLPGAVECTAIATHRIFACNGAYLMCSTAAIAKQREVGFDRCSRCGHRTEECWDIKPL